MSGYDILCTLVALFIPPLAVFMKRGLHKQFWISLLLTILGYLPGMIYALYVVYKYPHLHHWPDSMRPPAATGPGSARF